MNIIFKREKKVFVFLYTNKSKTSKLRMAAKSKPKTESDQNFLMVLYIQYRKKLTGIFFRMCNTGYHYLMDFMWNQTVRGNEL